MPVDEAVCLLQKQEFPEYGSLEERRQDGGPTTPCGVGLLERGCGDSVWLQAEKRNMD